MEAREPVSLNATNAAGVGLQVEFAWRHDRHAHTINLFVDDRLIPVFESVEGTNVDIWPPSAPLQQLSVEELRPATRVALLVGMAGNSHWSMSVEPAADRAAFVFDVACRSRDAAEQLGSGYSHMADKFTAVDECGVELQIEGHSLQLRSDREGATAGILRISQGGLRIDPAATIASGTTRWRYSIEVQ